MIQALYINAVTAAVRESLNKEDEDVIIVDKVTEDSPICTSVQELRDWVQGQDVDRKIEYLFIHCTGGNPTDTVSAILKYWKRKGWSNPGYNVILPQEGFTVLADLDSVTNGVKGYNSKSIHISYIGGKDGDSRTASQARLIRVFIEECLKKFPGIIIKGHNEVSSKSCPSFSVSEQYPEFF